MKKRMHAAAMPGGMHRGAYRRLGLMIGLSFLMMYGLMYAMVDSLANVYGSFNQVYMAGVMAAPMLALELLLMGAMYKDRRRNLVLIAVSIALTIGFWVLVRQQAAIGDRQFLRSMIPHHAGALLMCGRLHATDPRVRALCADILKSQQAEIAQMKALLAEGKQGQSAN